MTRFCALGGSIPLIYCLVVLPASAADAQSSIKAGPPLAECPNAAVIYWHAFAAMPISNSEDEQWEKVSAASKSVDAPLSPEVQKIISRCRTSLRELERARHVPCCDWQLDYEAGPWLRLTHLQQARMLSRAALVRSRLRFAGGEMNGAASDAVSVLKLARDCGGSPVLVSMLVDAAIEEEATAILAANLPRLNPQQLDDLAEAIKQLPPTPSLAESVRSEAKSFGEWLERRTDALAAELKDPLAGGKIVEAIQLDLNGSEPAAADAEAKRRQALIQSMSVADVRESLRQMQADYATMATIASLPYAEQTKRWAEFEAELAAAGRLKAKADLKRHFSTQFLPHTHRAYDQEEEMVVRRALLGAAVQVQRHGPEALQSLPQIGKDKIRYQKTDHGFELSSRCAAVDKTVVVRVGTAK